MKILVTGGAGFIGSQTVDALLKTGHTVRVTDIVAPRDLPNRWHGARGPEYAQGDILDPAHCQKVCEGMDAVFHAAAICLIPVVLSDPRAAREINVTGTANMLKAAAARGVRRFVFASSAKVYGDTGGKKVNEDFPLSPQTPYSESKREAEELCRDFQSRSRIPTTILRYFSVYGPRQRLYGGLIGDLMKSAFNGHKLTLRASLDMTRDFVYIEDAVQAAVLALDTELEGINVFNAGSGEQCTVKELIRHLRDVTGFDLEIVFDPMKPKTVLKNGGDVSRARDTIGYAPGTQIREGLDKTYQWFLGNNDEK